MENVRTIAQNEKLKRELFRISVNLERYFSDERKRLYVGVRGERPVRWLVRRLQRQFALPGRVAALCRGHLLPPAERLALLQPDDTLHLVPVQGDWYDRLAKGLISSNENIENMQEAKQGNSSQDSQNKDGEETYKDLEEINNTITPNHAIELSPLISSNIGEHNQFNLSDVCDTQNESDMLACSNNMNGEFYNDSQNKDGEKAYKDLEELNILVPPNHAVEPSPLISSAVEEHNLPNVCNTQNENDMLACSDNMNKESYNDCQNKDREETYKELEELNITLPPNLAVEPSPLITTNVGEHNLSNVCNTQNGNDMLACSNDMNDESYNDDSLQYRKKWALALLQKYRCTVSDASDQSAAPVADTAPTRRRRVRRRKRPAKVLLESSPPARSLADLVTAMDCERSASELSTDEGCKTERAWTSPAPVLRNQSAQRRRPRTVRSLSLQPPISHNVNSAFASWRDVPPRLI